MSNLPWDSDQMNSLLKPSVTSLTAALTPAPLSGCDDSGGKHWRWRHERKRRRRLRRQRWRRYRLRRQRWCQRRHARRLERSPHHVRLPAVALYDLHAPRPEAAPLARLEVRSGSPRRSLWRRLCAAAADTCARPAALACMCLHCACALRSLSFACSSRSTRAVSAARCGWRLSPAESFLSLAPSAAIDWPICSISACLASAARFISSRLPLQHSRSERSSLRWHLSPANS